MVASDHGSLRTQALYRFKPRKCTGEHHMATVSTVGSVVSACDENLANFHCCFFFPLSPVLRGLFASAMASGRAQKLNK